MWGVGGTTHQTGKQHFWERFSSWRGLACRQKAEEKVRVFSKIQRMKSTCCLYCWPLTGRGTRQGLEGRTSGLEEGYGLLCDRGRLQTNLEWAVFLETQTTQPHLKEQLLKAVPVSGSLSSKAGWRKTKSRRLYKAAGWHTCEWEAHALWTRELIRQRTSTQPLLSTRNCVSSELAQLSPTHLFFS